MPAREHPRPAGGGSTSGHKARRHKNAHRRLQRVPHASFDATNRAHGQLRRAYFDARGARVQHRQPNVLIVARDELNVLSRAAPALGEQAARDSPQGTDRLASKRHRRLGLFDTRDEETVHVYPLLRQAGLEPDRDVVVVSCDNEQVRLSTLSPRPASIDLGAADIARHAVRRLAARINHRDEAPVRILVNPQLIDGDESNGANPPSVNTPLQP